MIEIDVAEVLGQLPGYITLHDLKGRFIWSNKLGLGFDESVVGTMADANIFMDDRARWWSFFRRAAIDREVLDYSVKVIVPAKPGWAKIQGRLGPILRNGEVIYVVSLNYDATFHPESDPRAKFMLSELERGIVVTLLASKKPIKSAAISARVGEGRSSSKLRTILANLADRGIVTSTAFGYTISEQFRAHALDLIS